MTTPYQAILLVSFGGPEGRDQVLPFLENVVRGRHVPPQRIQEVAQHYYAFDGISPLNDQNRQLIRALGAEMERRSWSLPIYWGNRNWHPFLADAMWQMVDDGITRALALVTAAFSSYSSCRQYLEDIERARQHVGPRAPQIDKVRPFFNHPGFIAAVAQRVSQAWSAWPLAERRLCQLVFSAHSIPLNMAKKCAYVQQLNEAAGLVARALAHDRWTLVYQSRSGPPAQPWLEPDVCQYLIEAAELGIRRAVLVPIGFLSDHIEVLYDLDHEAFSVAQQRGMTVTRAQTVGTDPRFVVTLCDLIEERLFNLPRQVIGSLAACPDVCPDGCCPPR